jgi:hypothetical protein
MAHGIRGGGAAPATTYWSGDGYSGYCGWINTDINNCYGPQGYPRQRAAYIQKFKKP